MTAIQIVSDLHLEFRGYNFKNIIKPSAPILCLLGDICACSTDDDWDVYTQFIKYISPQFKYILHIPGNHEYYTTTKNLTKFNTMSYINSKIKRFAKSMPNVFFLNNNTLRLNLNSKNYVFIGTTMWTGILKKNRNEIQNSMNDYCSIYYLNEKPKSEEDKVDWKSIRRYNVEDMSKIHIKSVRYVIKELKNTNPSDNVVILTHHKIYRSKPLYDIISHAYETDLFPNIIKPQKNLKLIAYGHTHVKDDRVIEKVRIVSNPKGYPNQQTKYNNTFIVTI